MRPRIARSVVTVPPRPREGMSRRYLDAVKVLPCVVCGRLGVDPHHLMRGLPEGERGIARRAADRWAIPLCRQDHDAAHLHGDDEEWLTERGVDGRALAQALWGARDDIKAMLRIIGRNLNARGVYVS